MTLLDVGTGGGTILIPAAKKLLPNGKAVGIYNWNDASRRAKVYNENVGLYDFRKCVIYAIGEKKK